MNLLFVPLLSLLVSAAFIGFKRTVADNLALKCFACGHVFLWRAGLSVVGSRVPSFAGALNVADQIGFVVYLGRALIVFHRGLGKFVPLRAFAAIVGVVVGSQVLTALAGRLLLSNV